MRILMLSMHKIGSEVSEFEANLPIQHPPCSSAKL